MTRCKTGYYSKAKSSGRGNPSYKSYNTTALKAIFDTDNGTKVQEQNQFQNRRMGGNLQAF